MHEKVQGVPWVLTRLYLSGLFFMTFVMGGISRAGSWQLGLSQASQASMQVARGHSKFLSSRCRVLDPHLEFRAERQCSSPVMTWISGFLWSFNRWVRHHLVWTHGSLLCYRAKNVVSGFLSSWHRDLRLSLQVPQECQTSHRVLHRYSGWQTSQCRGIRFIWSRLGHWVFLNSGKTPGVLLEFQVETASSWGAMEGRDSFPDKAGKWTLNLRWRGKNGALLEL